MIRWSFLLQELQIHVFTALQCDLRAGWLRGTWSSQTLFLKLFYPARRVKPEVNAFWETSRAGLLPFFQDVFQYLYLVIIYRFWFKKINLWIMNGGPSMRETDASASSLGIRQKCFHGNSKGILKLPSLLSQETDFSISGTAEEIVVSSWAQTPLKRRGS